LLAAVAKAVIATSALLYCEQMRRQQQKLAVRRDTIRQLAAAELVPVRGSDGSRDLHRDRAAAVDSGTKAVTRADERGRLRSPRSVW